MKKLDLQKLIREEVKNILQEETVKLGPNKNFVLKSDRRGVKLTKADPNDGGRIHSELYIFKDEIPEVIAFLNKNK